MRFPPTGRLWAGLRALAAPGLRRGLGGDYLVDGRDGPLAPLCVAAFRAATGGKLRLCVRPEDLPGPLGSDPRGYRLREESLADLRAAARQLAEGLGYDPRSVFSLVDCVGESAINALRHGGGGVATLSHDAGTIYCRVEDRGPGIPLDILPYAVLERGWSSVRSAGMGFFLMIRECDTMWLHTGPQGTTTVIAVNRVPRDPLDEYLSLVESL